ncbi:unnamed protein product [Closterium sp. NIES-54]
MHPCTHAPMPCIHASMHPCTHAPMHPCTQATTQIVDQLAPSPTHLPPSTHDHHPTPPSSPSAPIPLPSRIPSPHMSFALLTLFRLTQTSSHSSSPLLFPSPLPFPPRPSLSPPPFTNSIPHPAPSPPVRFPSVSCAGGVSSLARTYDRWSSPSSSSSCPALSSASSSLLPTRGSFQEGSPCSPSPSASSSGYVPQAHRPFLTRVVTAWTYEGTHSRVWVLVPVQLSPNTTHILTLHWSSPSSSSSCRPHSSVSSLLRPMLGSFLEASPCSPSPSALSSGYAF